MMQAFRSSAKVIAVVFAILMLVFVLQLSGVMDGGGGQRGTQTVGKINGQKVDTRTYLQLVQNQIDQQQRQAPGALGLEETQQVRDQVWEQLIQNVVLETEYKKHGITVSDDEVVAAIRSNPPMELVQSPEFQTNGQFDPAKYQRWLGSSSAAQVLPYLEAQTREQIRRSKLLRVITADVYLSDAALWQDYRDGHESVKIGLTPIIGRNIVPDSAVKVAPADVDAYYRTHQAALNRPKTAYLSYVALPRVISAADTQAALQRVQQLRQEIAGGTPFAEVAKRESADTGSGAQGGELGWFKKGQMVPPFDSAAFALPLKTLSPPVLSQFGYHLIEVEARQGDSVEARHILIPVELSGERREKLDAQTDTLERLAAEQVNPAALDTVARVLRLKIGQTLPVQQGTRVQAGPLLVPDAGVWAFQAKRGEISPIIETPNAIFLFRLDSTQAAGVPALATIRPQLERLVMDAKKDSAAKSIAQDFLQRVRGGTPMPEAAKAMGLPYSEFGPFIRTQPPLPNPAIVGAAFGLEEGQVSNVIDTEEGLYVIKVLAHTKADSAQFAKGLDDLRLEGIRRARQERVRNYLAALRKEAKVVDNRDKVFQTNAQASQQAPIGL